MVSKKFSLQSQFLLITSTKGSRCVFLGGQRKDNGGIQTRFRKEASHWKKGLGWAIQEEGRRRVGEELRDMGLYIIS